MRAIAIVVSVPTAVAIVVLLNLLVVAYVVDIVLAGRILLYLLLFVALPLMLTPIYWAGMAAFAPLSLALSDDADVSPAARRTAVAVAPVGIGIGFLLWQAENWLIYGLLDVTPRLYNWLFGWAGLAL